MGNIVPAYRYAYFYDVVSPKTVNRVAEFLKDPTLRAGNRLADFLNEHPDVEIVKLEFTNTVGTGGVVNTSVHLLYKE